VKKTARTAVVSLHALAGLAGADIFGYVEVLAHPEGKAAHQRPRLGPPKVAAQWAIVALMKNLLA